MEIVSQNKSEIEPRLCLIPSEALISALLYDNTKNPRAVLERMNGTLSMHVGNTRHFMNLQFVGTFRCIEFQVEIIDFFEFLLVKEL